MMKKLQQSTSRGSTLPNANQGMSAYLNRKASKRGGTFPQGCARVDRGGSELDHEWHRSWNVATSQCRDSTYPSSEFFPKQ